MNLVIQWMLWLSKDKHVLFEKSRMPCAMLQVHGFYFIRQPMHWPFDSWMDKAINFVASFLMAITRCSEWFILLVTALFYSGQFF